MQGLFANLPEPPLPAGHRYLVATVAVEQAIDRELDYLVTPAIQPDIHIGQRVSVPLGRNNRNAFGYVINLKNHSDFSHLKPLHHIDDSRRLLTARLLELARWMSRYYCTPLGTVLESVIPAAVKKRVGLAEITLVHLNPTSDFTPPAKKGKTQAILDILRQNPPEQGIEITRLAELADVTPATIRKLASKGLISISRHEDFGLPEQAPAGFTPLEPSLKLTTEQQKAMDFLSPQLNPGHFGVNLLHGITGSGKTEIYLRCIQQIVAQGKQAIVLVPEIALTPQTALRFTQRFPHVAILHSGLTATERHMQWRAISAGRSQVVIGARSAVFAPVPHLGLLVIDEEHESTYKQETAPRYHARDVAIKRAHLENAPVILGSATPSLETFYRIQYAPAQPKAPGHYIPLTTRATAWQLPRIELVDMKSANRVRHGIHLLSPRLEESLRKTLANGQQAILLLNRRGYSSFVHCSSCDQPIRCKYCDVAMTYHRHVQPANQSARAELATHSGQLQCHYCLAVNPLPVNCPDCGKKLSLFGLGTQRVEEELQQKFPSLAFARMDSDTMRHARDYERVLHDFGTGKIQMLMGTQMIAKGLDFPNVTLVGVISGDTALMLPDFRAAERTFQIITQVAGRAGRGEKPGTVILQTYMPDDPTIRAAITQDYNGFANRELIHRKQANMPPYSRMVRIILRDTDEKRLLDYAQEIAGKIEAAARQIPHITLQGPMPCSIGRIAGYLRQQILLSSPQASPLQQVLSVLRQQGDMQRGDRLAIDVDPISLL